MDAFAYGLQSVSSDFQKGISITMIEVGKQFIGFFLQYF